MALMALMTQRENRQFAALAARELTKALGHPMAPDTWRFRRSDGLVTIRLMSGATGNAWLACRHSESDAPSPFTPTSGKCNLHPRRGDNLELMLATHLSGLAEPDSYAHKAFSNIRFTNTLIAD